MSILTNDWSYIHLTSLMDERNLNREQDDGDGREAARSTDSCSATLRHSFGRISSLARRVAIEVESGDALSSEALEELLIILDGDDALAAFMAMQSLRETLQGIHGCEAAHQAIGMLITNRPDQAKASRFQLIRQLIKAPKDHADTGSVPSSDGDKSSGEDSAPNAPHEWYLGGLLVQFSGFESLVRRAFGRTSGSFNRTHEAIGCLQDIAKRASSEETSPSDDDAAVEVTRLIAWVVTQAAQWNFRDGDEQAPMFLACGLIDLLVDARAICQAADTPWLPLALQLIKPSGSISSLSLRLLQDASTDADACCADSFVSSTSPYPLLQKWLLLCSTTAFEALQDPDPSTLSALNDQTQWTTFVTDLPPRARLLAVLTEQDDTMIDVLLLLLQISSTVQDRQTMLFAEAMRYLDQQLDPHLLFADLLGIFGDDHLVILDMLMSSETRMLEYASHYLRHAAASWSRTCAKWHNIDRTDAVMAVLIRLRLEMERLVDAGVFPYNPRPFLRRLEALEELFENQ